MRRERSVAALRRGLPLCDISLEGVKLLLELVAEDVDVEGGAVVDAPDEDDGQEAAARPAVPEPDGRGQHGEHGGEHELADPRLGVRLAQPGEAGGAAGGDLVAATHGDQKVVGQLPDGVWDGGPHHHLGQAVVVRRGGVGVADVVDGRVVLFLVLGREQMDDAVERHARHDVDEETVRLARVFVLRGYTPDDLVHGVEDERVAPHDDGDGVVAHDQAVGGDEETLRLGEDPDAEDGEDVDKVAQVGQEVVVALLVWGK
ncbi:hypothetical protein OPT61_g10671 [Boeremia exigua]|uniref:Uncharacterized protein n=1 Tax=Boeremia exigua TaxID=749465 RepID=A0ACC2HNH7_9PLEO|nr:hypothetical protein OPT61_g10671 [Boeremia exigua]